MLTCALVMAGRETAALEMVHIFVDIEDSGLVPPMVEVLFYFCGIL